MPGQLTAGAVSALLQLPLYLPAVLVVRPVVEELAAVWRRSGVSQDDISGSGYFEDTHLQNHRTQSPYSPCRYPADSPT